jgi:two-component system, NtrC family, nitrogen regulation response regulator GlnG
VRIIAATHQDLEQRVKEGGFREDLFHRLNVIRLRLPALRERREDISALTKHFLQQSAKQLGVEPKRISPAALARLSQFAFPGNVRQLENVCHWLTVMAPTQVIDEKDLPPEVMGTEPAGGGGAASAVAGASNAGSSHAGTASTAPQAAFVAGYGAAEAAQDAPNSIASSAISTRANALNASESAPADMVAPQDAFHDPLSPHHSARNAAITSGAGWEADLATQALALLAQDKGDVWDQLTTRFERTLIAAALSTTRNRRIEAAVKLGIGRNTITRKIQELGLE